MIPPGAMAARAMARLAGSDVVNGRRFVAGLSPPAPAIVGPELSSQGRV